MKTKRKNKIAQELILRDFYLKRFSNIVNNVLLVRHVTVFLMSSAYRHLISALVAWDTAFILISISLFSLTHILSERWIRQFSQHNNRFPDIHVKRSTSDQRTIIKLIESIESRVAQKTNVHYCLSIDHITSIRVISWWVLAAEKVFVSREVIFRPVSLVYFIQRFSIYIVHISIEILYFLFLKDHQSAFGKHFFVHFMD